MSLKQQHDSRAIKSFLALSLLAHLAFAAPLEFFNPFNLGNPVLQSPPIMVELRQPVETPAAEQASPAVPAAPAPLAKSAPSPQGPRAASPTEQPGPAEPESPAAPAAQQRAVPAPIQVPAEPAAAKAPDRADQADQAAATREKPPLSEPLLPPLRKTEEFLSNDRELLTYRISMLGIPVGTGELEARQENGEVRITLRIKSNEAISQLYPVDDWVETRHVGGNFILSRIRQREGSFRGDRGFTLFLRDKSVFWIDRLKNLSLREPLPSNDVLDILSAVYYLRNQQLEVGKPVLLQLFDSNRYAPTSVAVLRKEHLTLPGLRQVDTVLVNPQLKTEGIFQRTGEIMVWLTDDQNKVPVKVETRIPLGVVTAELVSAEIQQHGESPPAGDAAKKKAAPAPRPR